MRGIFTRFFKDKKAMTIGFCLGALGFIEMYVALFPSIQKQANELNKMMESFPKEFMKVFGMDSAQLMFAKLENYMSTEYFSFFWPILVTIMAISFANAICVGEIEKKTIEITLAQPISRAKILLSRYLGGALAITLFTVVSSYGILGFAFLHKIDYSLANYATVAFVGTLCGLAIFSIATFFSVLFSERGRSTMATVGILLLMYALNIISGLKDSLQNLKYVSFFHYFNAPEVFGNNRIVDWSIIVFAGTILLFLLAAVLRFQKRDISV
ncbi:MAG: ABC transporter permease subunit [bacterium]|nr:ABC transporter permease subunit [bacterium]